MREPTKFSLQNCLPKPFLSEKEGGNFTSKLKTSTSATRHFFATTTTTSFFPSTQFTNHESLPSFEDARAQFMESYPQYSNTHQIDEIRDQEYYHLSLTNHACFDYIGIGLFSFSQTQLHNQLYRTCPEGSTSYNPTIQESGQSSDIPLFTLSYRSANLKLELLNNNGTQSRLESAIKRRIRDFLSISEDDYCLVFTANRTSAFKVLADSYPYQSHKKLLTVYDHQSDAVEAMISSSGKRGAQAMEAEFVWPRMTVQSTKLKNMLEGHSKKKKKQKGLFVFQLQSRMTGARYSYQWMKIAKENGWHVLLDACTLGPKNMDSFGISLLQPEFIVCSFYKVFGENPTGFGCLFVKKSVLPILEKSTIVGIATITTANKFLSSPADGPRKPIGEVNQIIKSNLRADQVTSSNAPCRSISAQVPLSGLLEPEENPDVNKTNNCCCAQHNGYPTHQIQQSKSTDNTTSHNQSEAKVSEEIQARIEFRCLDHVDSMGLTLINSRGRYLTNWLINALLKLRHPNSGKGSSLVRIYGPKVKFSRGPALAFNVFDWKGEKIEPQLVQKLGDRQNVSLSVGFLHNIWFPEKYGGDEKRVLEKKEKGNENLEYSGGKEKKREDGEVGVRVVTSAVGILTNFEDTYRLWVFIAHFLDADFVEKERWRYRTLDQTTVEI